MSKRFRAKQKSFYDDSTKKTRSVWLPQIKIDGKWCYLKDESSPTGIMESHFEMNAIEKAIRELRKMGER